MPPSRIEVVTEITAEHVDAFARLMPQHSPGALPPTLEHLQRVVASPANTVFVARDDRGALVGSLTLTIFMTPGGTIGWIEDVVVDEAARGRGIGEALVQAGVARARALGARQIDLHSGNHRQAAIRLYQRVGFKKFETNVWRFLHET
jgi:ribosomal protein S18 acetylase RimI-like enzyme